VSVSLRLAAFALVVLLVFGAGLGLGAVAGPFDDEPPPTTHEEHP